MLRFAFLVVTAGSLVLLAGPAAAGGCRDLSGATVPCRGVSQSGAMAQATTGMRSDRNDADKARTDTMGRTGSEAAKAGSDAAATAGTAADAAAEASAKKQKKSATEKAAEAAKDKAKSKARDAGQDVTPLPRSSY